MRSEVTDDKEDTITIEELTKVLQHAKNRESCGLDNLPMELWKFGGNELKMHILELFIAFKIQFLLHRKCNIFPVQRPVG